MRPPTALTATALLALTLLTPAGCRTARPSPKEPPPGRASENGAGYNLLIISLSNVSAQRMSLYGYKRKTTPRLDAWAKDAWTFDHAFTHASWTLPAATSLFTGMYPYSHKILVRDTHNVLRPELQTLPELLRDAGWRTAAFTGGLDYFKDFSHMRGYQDASNNPNYSGFRTTLPQAKAWLARNKDQKFFLFVHGYDTHCPFTPSAGFAGTFSGGRGKNISVRTERCVRGVAAGKDGFRAHYSGGCADFRKSDHGCDSWNSDRVLLTRDDVRYLSDLYDEEVLETDSLIGDFLASLEKSVLENTIIVILSDHGEMFAKHGRFGRAGTSRGTHYDDVLHIPLLIRLPGTPGRRIAGLAQMIDVMPTLLSALGLPIPSQVQGKDLSPLTAGQTAVNESVFAGARYNTRPKEAGPDEERYMIKSLTESIRDLRWKYTREVVFEAPAPGSGRLRPLRETVELYDIVKDPGESDNLAEAQPETARQLRERLASWAKEAASANPETPRTREVPKELLRQARDRGYW